MRLLPTLCRVAPCALGLFFVTACGSEEADAGSNTADAATGGQAAGGTPTGGQANGGGAVTGGQGGQGGTPAPTADAAFEPVPDAAVSPALDLGAAPQPDAADLPQPDAGLLPEPDAAELPENDAGPEPAIGACVNAADQETLAAAAETLESAVGTCAFQCIADPAPGTCAGACVSMETGLSEGCAACFGGAVACTIANCIGQCLDAASAACAECRALNCNDDFRACAGIDPQ